MTVEAMCEEASLEWYVTRLLYIPNTENMKHLRRKLEREQIGI